MASPTTSTSSVLLLALVATVGLANLAVAARPVDAAALTSTAKHAMASSAGGGAELDGIMECMIGCFTQVMSCAFGCMGKGPDLPLCVISCNQKSIVCMIRCGLTPSPPGPSPPTPPAPTPKPPAPKPSPPPMPSPPGPPYAGHSTETSA